MRKPKTLVKSVRGRPRSLPDDTRVWAKRLAPAEIRAVEALVKRMRKK